MKKKITYIFCLIILFVLFYSLNRPQPQEFVWEQTYHTQDKQPYGAYAFDKLLKESWEKGYFHNYKKISDLQSDGSLNEKNLFIVTEIFRPAYSDREALFDYIKNGGKALISARYFGDLLSKRLNFEVGYNYFEDISIMSNIKQQYKSLHFCAPELNKFIYKIPDKICAGFFTYNSVEEIENYASVVAKTVDNEVVMIKYELGKGALILCSNPMIYTNYMILNNNTNMYIWNALAYLQDKPLIRTEYYHAGSNAAESQSPLRYLYSIPSLKWALIITIITIIVFMIFTAKRRQKVIPIVKSPKNRMLDFVHSVAGLYLQKNNNADIIIKKQLYWADNLKRKYGIDIINENHDSKFFMRLSEKMGKSINELSELFSVLDKIDSNTHISDSKMMEIITVMRSE
jgi:hypothetical protein